MKNILFIFALLLTLVVPTGSALALGVYDPIPVQLLTPTGGDPYQGVENGLNGISNAINAQTKAIQDAQTQQQLAALDQNCVTYVTAYINSKDTYIKETDQMIKSYIAQNEGKSLSDEEERAYASHLKYLYTLRGVQNQKYTDITINQCSKLTLNASCIKSNGPNAEMKSYDAITGAIQCKCSSGYVWSSASSACVIQQNQQTAPTSVLQCNGKSWPLNACPAGTTFACPPTGDAQCLQLTPQAVAPPTTKAKSATVSASLTKQETPAVASPVTNTFKYVPQPTSTPVQAKRGFWSWFKGLFWF